MVDSTVMCELKEMVSEQKKIEQKEKKKAYMREYMKKYHATKMANDEEYIEKYRANQRKANNKRREREEVREADRIYGKKHYENMKKQIALFKKMQELDICVSCKKSLEGNGNNPYPVSNTGKCCDTCNVNIIIPARLKLVGI